MATMNGSTKTAAPAKGSAQFAVEVNFAGVAPASGGEPLPVNKAFKCITRSVEQTYKKDGSGKITYTFKGEVIEPAMYAGRGFIKTMTDIKNEKAQNFWVTCLMSHGISRAALEKGKFKFSPALLAGKNCYLYTSPQPGQKYPNTEFMLPDIGEKRLAAQADAPEETEHAETAADEVAAPSTDDLFS